MRRQYGSKSPSRAHQRAALGQLLVLRPSLDGLDLASLSRSYGLSVPEIDRMIATERKRREVRA